MLNRLPFNSPPPKRFVQAWTSPLIPCLKDSASWDDADEKSMNSALVMALLASKTSPPLREEQGVNDSGEESSLEIKSWLDDEEKKSSVDSKSSTPTSNNRHTIFQVGSPSALAMAHSDTSTLETSKVTIPGFSPFRIYEAPSTDEGASFSPLTTPPPTKPATTSKKESKTSPSRPVLADISKNSEVEFVPNSWLSLYHTRPYFDANEHDKVAWLSKCTKHFRSPARLVPQGTPAPQLVTVPNTTHSKFSPLSIPSAFQSTRHSRRPSNNMHMVRSILKSAVASSDSSSGQSGIRGRLAVRFAEHHPRTTVKRPSFLQHPKQGATPTTWPQQPRAPMGDTADLFFRDIWEESRPRAAAAGWIPYQTPESKSSSSASGSHITNSSLAMSDKENKPVSVSAPASKSIIDHPTTCKSAPSRMPLHIKHERSASMKNILKEHA